MADLPYSEPLWVENLSPVASLVALPPQRSADQHNGWSVDSHVAIASHFASGQVDDTSAFFDGETTRLSLAMSYGWADDWAVRVTLPWVSQDAGFLDSTINGWHDFFGMSDGGRSQYPNDRFRYQFGDPGYGVDFAEQGSGLGDARIAIDRVIHRVPGEVASVSLGYKAATGDDDAFLGSGAGDWFMQARFSGQHRSDLPLMWHGQIGYTRAGDSDLIGPAQRSNLWFAGLTMDWRLSNDWSLLAQLDGHSAVLDSQVDALGEGGALMLSAGARWRFAPQWSLGLSFIEDIRVETAPDVTFQATLRWRPAQ